MRHLPNIICLCRIALIWPIVDALLGGAYERTLLLFAVAALSDGLDGWLAKRYGWTSRLGTWLDPIADKMLLVSMFLVLTWLGHIPRYLAVGAISRDVMIGLGAIAFRLVSGPVGGRPILSSKINTVLQIVFILLVVTHAAWAQPPATVLQAMALIIFLTVLYSGVVYLRQTTLRALQVAARP
jgi:cardiolipin synthase (CMP-forming)